MTREEAIKEAYGIPVTKAQHEALQFLIPELREAGNEDEMVRKALIDGVRQIRCKNGITQEQMLAYLEKQEVRKPDPKIIIDYEENRDFAYNAIGMIDVGAGYINNISRASIIEWLKNVPETIKSLQEKQSEKKIPLNLDQFKSLVVNIGREFRDEILREEEKKTEREVEEKERAEWSETDEKMRKHIISDLREFRDLETDEELISDYEEEIRWLKSLPLNLKKMNDDVAKLCSNEWSEEDERKLQKCIKIVERWEEDYDIAYTPYSDMLKSIRPFWKPSEEQMKALFGAIQFLKIHSNEIPGLKDLYNDLYNNYAK